MSRLRVSVLMAAQNACAHGDHALDSFCIILCPNCGSDGFRHRWDSPLRLVERSVSAMRALGHEDVDDVLHGLMNLINRLRYRFECNHCGSQYNE